MITYNKNKQEQQYKAEDTHSVGENFHELTAYVQSYFKSIAEKGYSEVQTYISETLQPWSKQQYKNGEYFWTETVRPWGISFLEKAKAELHNPKHYIMILVPAVTSIAVISISKKIWAELTRFLSETDAVFRKKVKDTSSATQTLQVEKEEKKDYDDKDGRYFSASSGSPGSGSTVICPPSSPSLTYNLVLSDSQLTSALMPLDPATSSALAGTPDSTYQPYDIAAASSSAASMSSSSSVTITPTNISNASSVQEGIEATEQASKSSSAIPTATSETEPPRTHTTEAHASTSTSVMPKEESDEEEIVYFSAASGSTATSVSTIATSTRISDSQTFQASSSSDSVITPTTSASSSSMASTLTSDEGNTASSGTSSNSTALPITSGEQCTSMASSNTLPVIPEESRTVDLVPIMTSFPTDRGSIISFTGLRHSTSDPAYHFSARSNDQPKPATQSEPQPESTIPLAALTAIPPSAQPLPSVLFPVPEAGVPHTSSGTSSPVIPAYLPTTGIDSTSFSSTSVISSTPKPIMRSSSRESVIKLEGQQLVTNALNSPTATKLAGLGGGALYRNIIRDEWLPNPSSTTSATTTAVSTAPIKPAASSATTATSRLEKLWSTVRPTDSSTSTETATPVPTVLKPLESAASTTALTVASTASSATSPAVLTEPVITHTTITIVPPTPTNLLTPEERALIEAMDPSSLLSPTSPSDAPSPAFNSPSTTGGSGSSSLAYNIFPESAASLEDSDSPLIGYGETDLSKYEK